jgi:hypothetical protein
MTKHVFIVTFDSDLPSDRLARDIASRLLREDQSDQTVTGRNVFRTIQPGDTISVEVVHAPNATAEPTGKTIARVWVKDYDSTEPDEPDSLIQAARKIERLKSLIPAARERASRVGPMHTLWDYIMDAEAVLKGARTLGDGDIDKLIEALKP